MPLPVQIQKFRDDLDKSLHEPNVFNNWMGVVEQKTKLKRMYFVAGVVGLISIYLIFGKHASLVCNFIGFVYPAYVSVIKTESLNKADCYHWLTYWVIFATLWFTEFFSGFFSDSLAYFLPFYWLIKCAVLLWLFLPVTRGASMLYTRVIHHLQYKKHQPKVDDEPLEEAGDNAHKTAKVD